MSFQNILLTLSVLSLFPLRHLTAQPPEIPGIATERPSVGTSADILPEHSAQIENGLNAVYSSQSYLADLPESLLRVGIGHNMEMRLTSSNLVHGSDAAVGSSLFEEQDLSFSMKTALARANSTYALPQALMVGISCPTGSAAKTSGSFDPSAILIWYQSWHNGLNLTENVSVLRSTTDGVRTDDWGLGVSVGRSFNHKLAWFAEYAPMFAAGAQPLHIFDAGFLYTPNPTTQFDVRFGRQNDPDGLNNILTLGYSFRVNKFGRRINPPVH